MRIIVLINVYGSVLLIVMDMMAHGNAGLIVRQARACMLILILICVPIPAPMGILAAGLLRNVCLPVMLIIGEIH